MTRYEQLTQQVESRFDDECWEWPTLNANGYGVLWYKGVVRKAHVLAYILRYGDVPQGLELDHTCLNKGCYNSDHVEPVTRKENAQRNPNWTGNRTECPSGHPYSLQNTRYNGKGARLCIACYEALKASRRERRQYLAMVT